MDNRKFENIFKLLSENHFETCEIIPDNVKCLKCGKILINACQGPCGCRYCRVCVDNMLQNNNVVCLGATDECKETNLSSFHTDYFANRAILNLLVKCPEEMCTFSSEVINMIEHLRVCPKKSLNCIFYGLGCDQSKLTAENMNEHLQLENYNHMKILMGIIDNMRNEMDRSKESDAKNKNEIEILRECAVRNRNEIEMLKQDLVAKTERIESLEEEIKDQHLYSLKREFSRTMTKMNSELNEIRQECKDALDINESLQKEIKKYQMHMDNRMNVTDKWVDKLSDRTFLWTIDNVADRRKNDEYIRSEYFYGKEQPYKMALEMSVNGYRSVAGIGLSVYVLVSSDTRDQWLKWSLPVNITIRIANKAKPDVCRMITKCYTIKMPDNNSYYRLSRDADFNFNYADLFYSSLVTGDRFIVECCVDL